jgi:hypothetical protein
MAQITGAGVLGNTVEFTETKQHHDLLPQQGAAMLAPAICIVGGLVRVLKLSCLLAGQQLHTPCLHTAAVAAALLSDQCTLVIWLTRL